ncbi:TRAP transporter small permease [Parenemella sanctibonifatiensis]|uniref:C4-dicarboxylate ABC transporter permease n=1 Tax=Parenemella sanctibonifatiensis TaxID=2016505 RepID=A0A255EID0_9ACTN|nr:TRAP transporter small permease [Parenemella sanctibonifatiensis]OYN89365.1 C4-dicarboxylate ABC transporter permease [Parenemella sanctibonifatiensis]
MEAVLKVKSGVDVFLRWFCIALFAALVLLVVWQVFVRQVLHSGSPWSEAAGRIVFIWQGLIGAAYVIGEKDDVAIDFLVRRVPQKFAKAVEILAHLIVAAFAGVILVYGGSGIVMDRWADTVQLLPVTEGVLYLVLPITGALILFYEVVSILQTITAEKLEVADPNEMDIDDIVEEGL